jgi:hypothetical protein
MLRPMMATNTLKEMLHMYYMHVIVYGLHWKIDLLKLKKICPIR